MFVGVLINTWVFSLVLLVLLTVLMPIPGYFQYSSSVVEFEVRICVMPLEVLLLYRFVSAILGFLLFYINLSTVLLSSFGNMYGNFSGI